MKKYKIKVSPNKSLTYMLPMLVEEFNLRFPKLMINSYVINNEEERYFCVLYKFLGRDEYTKFEGRLMEHDLYLGHEDYEEHVLYKFRLNPDMEKELELFKEGKYSQFSKKHKEDINSFLKKKQWSSDKVNMILNRSEVLINIRKKKGIEINDGDELLEKPNMEDENFSNNLNEIEYVREYED